MTVQEALHRVYQQLCLRYEDREATNMIRIISEDALGVFNTQSQKTITSAQSELLESIAQQLTKGIPLQYVLGMADFYGYKFHVDNNVLIPRPETEELVYTILNDFSDTPPRSVLDIGTGSGCIPISIKKNRPSWNITAIDISEGALGIAQKNAALNEVKIGFSQQDILDEKKWEMTPSFDIIISNPPYIPHREISLMPDHVIDNEPHLALFVENDDPFLFYRKITHFAQSKLNKNGRIYFETNEYNAKEVLHTLTTSFAMRGEIIQDLSGKDRIIVLHQLNPRI